MTKYSCLSCLKGVAGRVLLGASVFAIFLAHPATAWSCESSSSAEQDLEDLSDGIAERLENFVEDVTNFIYDDLRLTATTEAITRLDEYNAHLYPQINRWWEIMGAKKGTGTSVKTSDATQLQKFTAQVSAAKITQTMQLGMLIDAQVLQEVIRAKQEQRLEGYRRNRMDDMMCQVDSAPRTQTKAFKTARALSRAWAMEDRKRTGNFVGSISENGSNAELGYLWEDYKNKFCDPAMGDQGCVSAGTRAGAQTNLPDFLWQERQTVDTSDQENRNAMLAAQQTLVTPFSPDPLPNKVLWSAEGKEMFMQRRAKQARINTVYNVVGQLLGERSKGDKNDYIKQIRKKAGAPADTISDNPSYSEIRETMARLRYMDPEYFGHLAGPPENVLREQNVIGAIRLQQMNDYYKRSEEMLALEAASYADELDQQPQASGVTQAPLN